MPTYATPTDVFARVRGLIGDTATAFSSSTVPTLTEVEDWMDEGVGALHACLRSVNITPIPQTDSFAVARLAELETRYTEGRVRRVIAGAAGDQGNTDGQDQLDSFFEECEKIKANRVLVQQAFEPGNSVKSAQNYVTNPQGPDALTTADWAPRFKRNQKF